jgi:20S proteasome subunit alpha 1
LLSRRIANLNQVSTQQAAMRPLGVSLTFIGMDMEDGGLVPHVYKCDPAGFYIGYAGTAAGSKATEAINALEKKVIKTEDSLGHFGETLEATIECAILTLAQVVSQEFKVADIEVGVVTRDNPRFSTLSMEQIEAALTKLAEKD